jgi:hypothetical protein
VIGMDKKLIPISIKNDKKTFELFDRIDHSMTVMFGLMTMLHFRKLTKRESELTDEKLAELKQIAEGQAKLDMLVLFERLIKELK